MRPRWAENNETDHLCTAYCAQDRRKQDGQCMYNVILRRFA
jgi:hypothetical protein